MAKLAPDQFRKRLERGLRECGHTHTAEDIQRAVEAGTMQSWVNNDSLVLTEVISYPQGKKLNVVLVVGDLDDVMEVQPRLDEFARQHGCSMMMTTGRLGWKNVLPSYGWKKSNKIIFERSL